MTKGELEAMTKDELVDYADDNDIDVQRHWVKDEIIKEILKAEKAVAKQEAKEDKPEAKSAEQSAKKSDDQPQIDPELAANQELAQKLPDEATRFAAPAPEEEK